MTLTSSSARRRVLVAVIVYNGRSFVPQALSSASRLQHVGHHDVDVLVLDDASPEPGWSAELSTLCANLGIGYYCTPRNLGIPRNMNLALLRAESAGYDHVVISNSDVLLPVNLVDVMVPVAESDPRIASVTAWSNNASLFSLPNTEANRYLNDLPTVDWVSSTLQAEMGAEAPTIPTGVGFNMCIPVRAVTAIGLFDPVFGRGYCEEVDWCQRAVAMGWRHVLAPGVFAYHIGSASTRLAGLLAPGEQTVHTHELIIDQRHPDYRSGVAAWEASGGVSDCVERGLRALVQRAARERGWVVEASWLHREVAQDPHDRVRIVVQPDGPSPLVEAVTQGWHCPIPVDPDGILTSIGRFLGVPAHEVRVLDHGSNAAQLTAAAQADGIPVRLQARYPERV